MQITESKLKALIEEEIALMIENGEIDEGVLDRIGAPQQAQPAAQQQAQPQMQQAVEGRRRVRTKKRK